MMTVTIRRDNDPFKKYWWVILLAFGLVGGWVCLPLMDTGTGSAPVAEGGLKSLDQSLDSIHNPIGAPGSAVDLSMEGSGAYRKKAGGPVTSSLYQPPPESAAPAEPAASGGGNLADALKDVSRKTALDPTGWGGARPQRGFSPPKANFGSLSGLGSGSSSSVSSGYGGSSPGSGGLSAFGAPTPKTGIEEARGLGSQEKAPKAGAGAMKSLEAASIKAISAAQMPSMDAARAIGGQSFDGSSAGSRIGGGGAAALSGPYARLDAAPVNLKMNNPALEKKEIAPPPAKPVEDEMSQRERIMQMIMMMVVGGVVNGLVGGVLGLAGLGAGA